MQEKRIELCKMRAVDLKTGFGNPRKISPKKLKELEQSLKDNGDFGIFLIDEKNNVIAGNQRLKAIKHVSGEDTLLDCKRLIGYTNAELRMINIKDNTHAGEWDLDMLADWAADLTVDLGLKESVEKEIENREISEMELIHYEKYDYVLIACRNVIDYNNLVRTLGIENKKVRIAKSRKINARAIWYDKMNAKIVPMTKEEIAQRDETEKKVSENDL